MSEKKSLIKDPVYHSGYTSGYHDGYQQARLEVKGAVWVRATERLPGWDTLAEWRFAGKEPTAKETVRFLFSAANLHQWEWLDESRAACESPAEQPVDQSQFIREYKQYKENLKYLGGPSEWTWEKVEKLNKMETYQAINGFHDLIKFLDNVLYAYEEGSAQWEERALKAEAAAEQPAGKVDKEIIDFIRDVATNWDCDEDGHKYNTGCRKCDASELLYELSRKHPSEWSGEREGSGKDANETGRVFINKILLLAAGFVERNKDYYEYFVKDKVKVWDFNGEYWIVDMLEQAGIEKQFRYMDELETLFHAFGLSFYNQQEQK